MFTAKIPQLFIFMSHPCHGGQAQVWHLDGIHGGLQGWQNWTLPSNLAFTQSGPPNVGLRFTNKPDGEGLCEISDTNWFQDHGRGCKHEELTCKYTWKSMLAEGWSSSVWRWPLCSTLHPGQWSCSTSRDGLFLFLLKNYRFVMKTTSKKRKTERSFKK